MLQCLSNASQHVPIYLQPFLKYSSGGSRGGGGPIDQTNFCINVKSHLRMNQNPPFSGENSFFSGERAAPSQDPSPRPSTPHYKILDPPLRYSGISVASDWFSTVLVSEWVFFNHILLSPGYAPGTIAVNVTLLERGFNACKTPRCIYPSFFNGFLVIQDGSLKVHHFSTFFAHFGLPCVRPWDNHGKCYMDRKRIQCPVLQFSRKTVPDMRSLNSEATVGRRSLKSLIPTWRNHKVRACSAISTQFYKHTLCCECQHFRAISIFSWFRQ